MELDEILNELFKQGYTAVTLYKRFNCKTYVKPDNNE